MRPSRSLRDLPGVPNGHTRGYQTREDCGESDTFDLEDRSPRQTLLQMKELSMTNVAVPDPKRRALGKGLDSLIPRPASASPAGEHRTAAGRARSRSTRSTATPSKRAPMSTRSNWRSWLPPLRRMALCSRCWFAPWQRALSADRGRTALAGFETRGQKHGSRDSAPSLRRTGDGDHHRRKPATRRPERDGAGSGLRTAGAGVPHDSGANGATHGKRPRNCL